MRSTSNRGQTARGQDSTGLLASTLDSELLAQSWKTPCSMRMYAAAFAGWVHAHTCVTITLACVGGRWRTWGHVEPVQYVHAGFCMDAGRCMDPELAACTMTSAWSLCCINSGRCMHDGFCTDAGLPGPWVACMQCDVSMDPGLHAWVRDVVHRLVDMTCNKTVKQCWWPCDRQLADSVCVGDMCCACVWLQNAPHARCSAVHFNECDHA